MTLKILLIWLTAPVALGVLVGGCSAKNDPPDVADAALVRDANGDPGGADVLGVDATAGDVRTVDAVADARGGLTQSGDAAVPAPYAVRLAYFPGPTVDAPPFADLCFRLTSGTTWTRAYGSPGIGLRQVGRYAALASRGDYALRVIAASGDCEGSAIHQTSTTIGADSTTNRATFLYRNGVTPTGAVSSVTYHRFNVSDLTGVDRVQLYNLAVPGTPVHVVDFSDGTTRTRLRGSSVNLTEATPGNVIVDYSDATPDVLHPYLPALAHSTSIFLTGAGDVALFCDDLVPPDGILARCSATLRAP